MKEIIFNKKDYKSYKDLYHDICIKLEKDAYIDWNGQYEDLGYNADLLDEFIWYCHDENVKCIFIGFDREKIAKKTNYQNYEYNLIFEVFEDFVKQFPNNQLEFRDE